MAAVLSYNLTFPTLDGGGDGIANVTSKTESKEYVTVVSTAILTMTILGALSILCSMFVLEWRGRPSTMRTRLVQSLVVSDFVLGIVGLIGSAVDLDHGLKKGTTTCDGLGFMLVTVLWTEHVWTFFLAFATYMILIYPLHTLTTFLERKWYWLWAVSWGSAIAVGLIGYELYGYAPNGGICYYGSDAGLYGELIQFVPRGLVFVCISFFYARLFVFLRRPDRIRSFNSQSPTGSYDGVGSGSQANARGAVRKLSKLLMGRRKSSKDDSGTPPTGHEPQIGHEPKVGHEVDLSQHSPERVQHSQAHSPTGFMSSGLVSPTSEVPPPGDIPPWEKMDLPVFQIDGQRYGGSMQNTQGSLWGNWKGLSGREQKKRPSTASSSSPPTMAAARLNSISSARSLNSNTSPINPATARFDPISSTIIDEDADPGAMSHHGPSAAQLLFEGRRRRSADLSGSISSISSRLRQQSGTTATTIDPVTPIAPSSAYIHSGLAPDQQEPRIRRASALSHATDFSDSRRSSAGLSEHRDGKPRTAFSDAGLSDREMSDVEGGGRGARSDAEDDDEEFDLMRMLQQSRPSRTRDDRFAPSGIDNVGEVVEFVPESMSSYLNRKTALLMLWFPLGYVLLFSVSLIRIIYDFAGNPPTPLRAVSRWFIFAQGILDALIYGLVEWHTKRVVRRRVRKGAFTPTGSRNTAGTSSRPRGTGSGAGLASNLAAALRFSRGSGSGSGSGAGEKGNTRRASSPTASYNHLAHVGAIPTTRSSLGRIDEPVHPERSILQELELGETDLQMRKGSMFTDATGTSTSEGTTLARDSPESSKDKVQEKERR